MKLASNSRFLSELELLELNAFGIIYWWPLIDLPVSSLPIICSG